MKKLKRNRRDVDILLLQFHSDPQLWFRDLLVRHGNHSPCPCFIEKIFSALPYLGSWIQDSSLTRVFWFFPTALIKPSSSQWIDHSTTVGSWRIVSSYPCKSWRTISFFLNLFPSLCSEPRSRQFLVLEPAGWSTPVWGNTR